MHSFRSLFILIINIIWFIWPKLYLYHPTARRSNPGCSLEGLMLKLKLNTLATSCEELTHWKRSWCWEGLGAGGEGDDRGWDGWMASLTRWAWVRVNSGSLWWPGRPGVLRFMGSHRVGRDWATELNWTELRTSKVCIEFSPSPAFNN